MWEPIDDDGQSMKGIQDSSDSLDADQCEQSGNYPSETEYESLDSIKLVNGVSNLVVDKVDDGSSSRERKRGDNQSSTSGGLGTVTIRRCMEVKHQNEIEDAKQMAEKLVQEAERSKTKVAIPKGKDCNEDDDDDFYHHTAHIESSLIVKIELGLYVDLAKLLPKEIILHPSGCLNLVNRDCSSFFVPANKNDPPTPSIPTSAESKHLIFSLASIVGSNHLDQLKFYSILLLYAGHQECMSGIMYIYMTVISDYDGTKPSSNWGKVY